MLRAMPPRRLGVGRRIGGVALLVGTLALIGGAMLASTTVQAAGDCTVSAGEAAMDGEEQALLNAVNAFRQQNGVGALSASGTLSRAAAWKARDNGTKGTIHTDSLGRLPHIMNGDCGYTGSITGENLSAGQSTAAAVVEAWKGSSTHSRNMLRPEFRAAGVGRFTGGTGGFGTYWALEMGNAADGATASAPATTSATSTTTSAATANRPATTQPATTQTTTSQTPSTTTAANTQPGIVIMNVELVNSAGQPVQGDLSGFILSLAGAGTFLSPPTNAQGQTTMTVPAGSYAITEQPRAGATLRSLSVNGAPVTNLTVNPNQVVAVTATNQLTSAAAPATNSTTPASTSTTPAASMSSAPTTLSLPTGCTNVILTWPAGTALSTVMAAFSDSDAVAAIWRYDAETHAFQAYAPATPVASNYSATRGPLEAVFACLTEAASLTRPGV